MLLLWLKELCVLIPRLKLRAAVLLPEAFVTLLSTRLWQGVSLGSWLYVSRLLGFVRSICVVAYRPRFALLGRKNMMPLGGGLVRVGGEVTSRTAASRV